MGFFEAFGGMALGFLGAGLAACLLLVTGGAVYFLGQERIPAARPDPDSHPETSVQTEQTMLTEHNAQNTENRTD